MVIIANKAVRKIGSTWGIVVGKGLNASVYKWNAWSRQLHFTVVDLKDLGGTFTPSPADLAAARVGF